MPTGHHVDAERLLGGMDPSPHVFSNFLGDLDFGVGVDRGIGGSFVAGQIIGHAPHSGPQDVAPQLDGGNLHG